MLWGCSGHRYLSASRQLRRERQCCGHICTKGTRSTLPLGRGHKQVPCTRGCSLAGLEVQHLGLCELTLHLAPGRGELHANAGDTMKASANAPATLQVGSRQFTGPAQPRSCSGEPATERGLQRPQQVFMSILKKGTVAGRPTAVRVENGHCPLAHNTALQHNSPPREKTGTEQTHAETWAVTTQLESTQTPKLAGPHTLRWLLMPH